MHVHKYVKANINKDMRVCPIGLAPRLAPMACPIQSVVHHMFHSAIAMFSSSHVHHHLVPSVCGSSSCVHHDMFH